MTYVDGFVLAVPKKSMKTYQKMAKAAGKVWMKYGALQYFECWGDEISKNYGYCTNFKKTIKLKPTETAVFAFIIYKSRKHRDEVNKKVMSDPKLMESCDPENMPFDCKRMTYGGFKAIVEY